MAVGESREPQELDYEAVPTVQTFFEVQGGGRLVQRVVRLIAPAVHLLIRIVAFFIARRAESEGRAPPDSG